MSNNNARMQKETARTENADLSGPDHPASGSSVAAPVDESLPEGDRVNVPWRGLAARLRSKFGLGASPHKRMKLYVRLEALCAEHGSEVYLLLCAAAAQAVKKQLPDRYFCKTACRALRDAGHETTPEVPPI